MSILDKLVKKKDPNLGYFGKVEPKEPLPVAEMPDEMNQKVREDFYNGAEEAEPDDRGKERESRKLLDAIETLSVSLIKKRDAAVTARASCGIEQIWREDELAFEGLDEGSLKTRMIDFATQTAPTRNSLKGPRRSRVVVNIIRPKCETAEGRFSEILLPTDGKNWGLKRTPVPELVKGLKDERPAWKNVTTGEPVAGEDGQPITVSAASVKVIEEADEKMIGMETEMDDLLTECNFNAECRKVIRSAVRLGTGVLKGPVVSKDLKKKWKQVKDADGTTARVLEMSEGNKPTSRAMDVWDVFPDPECRDDVRKAAYIWDREAILSRELRALIGLPGYLEDQIQAVLLEAPTRVMVAQEKDNQYLVRYSRPGVGNSYEKWEYNGELGRDDLEALGVDAPSEAKSFSACVAMVNDRPIKALINPLDTGELPFDFFVWTSRAGVPWGIGVAREMAWQQRIIVAAWRAMMDNSGDSSGAMLGLAKGVTPADGVWEVTGKKIWLGDSSQSDMRKAFHSFQITNNQKDLQAIIDLALRFIDMETNMPMIFTGEKGELPETYGATKILVDSNNVAFRSRVKLWDDSITDPHLTKWYDWLMQYGKNEENKGDYNVDARGISMLREKDQQAQDIKELLQIRADPELSDLVNWEKNLKKVLGARNLELNSEEKIAENRKKRAQAPAPADPALEVAKVRAEGEMAKAQMVQASDREELQFRAELAQVEFEQKMQIATIEKEIKMMELSATSGMALDKIKAQLTETAAKLNLQKELAYAAGKDIKPAEQVSTPISEPAGRAPEGQAYQK